MKVLGSWAVNERMDRLSVLCYYLANSCATSDDIESDRLTNMRYTKLPVEMGGGEQPGSIRT